MRKHYTEKRDANKKSIFNIYYLGMSITAINTIVYTFDDYINIIRITGSNMIIIIMGVSGAGKTTVGFRLSESLGCSFIDGDNFHSEANKAKMRSGTPLNDDDRIDWLYQLNSIIVRYCLSNDNAILACSALKASYREILTRGTGNCVKFVYLKCEYETVKSRLQNRRDHFFNIDLLKSQFEALEEPEESIMVDGSMQLSEIIDSLSHLLTQS